MVGSSRESCRRRGSISASLCGTTGWAKALAKTSSNADSKQQASGAPFQASRHRAVSCGRQHPFHSPLEVPASRTESSLALHVQRAEKQH